MPHDVPARASLATCSPASRPPRIALKRDRRGTLTPAARAASQIAGRDEKTAFQAEQENCRDGCSLERGTGVATG